MNKLQLNISYRQIVTIALPISFAILIPQLNFLINSVFLGQLGVFELGIAGIVGVYYLIFSSVGYGLNNGLQSLISRKAGANDIPEIGRLFSQGVIIALGIAFAGILITYTLMPVVLNSILKDQHTINTVIHFLKIRVWGMPFLFIYQMRNALLVGTNNSKYLPIGTAAETGVNIVLDYALIFGKLGFPELGLDGAAVASILAELTGMLVTFFIIYRKGISRQFQLFAHRRIDKVRLRKILQQSGPLMFQHAISIISWFLFYLLIGRMTASVMNLAISNTMRNLFGVFGIGTWALGSTTNTIISNIIGQGRRAAVPAVIKMLLRISFGFALIPFAILNLFPVFIFKLFNHDINFINNAVPVIRVVSVAMLMMSASVVLLNVVIASAKSKIAFGIEAIAILFYCIYIYLTVEVFKCSLTFAWMSEWLYWTILFILSYFYLRMLYKELA
jgi:putative MATE family efflux protein